MGMARRTRNNIPVAVRNAARTQVRDGEVKLGLAPKPSVKEGAKAAKVPIGKKQITQQARVNARENHIPNMGTREVKWLYQAGDLVKFRDYRGKVIIGTVIKVDAYTAAVMSAVGISQIPCGSLQLQDRLEFEELSQDDLEDT
jgi:hypothetical protein